MMRMLHGLSFRYRGERCCPPINRNFHFGFTTRTSIPAVASAESVSCIRFHPKGSGRPERAVSGTQSRVSLCFQAIFQTPLPQLPSFVQIGFALPPHAIIRLAPAEPPCAAACPLLLAVVGRKPSDASPVRKHAAADSGFAAAGRIGAAARRNQSGRRRGVEGGVSEKSLRNGANHGL